MTLASSSTTTLSSAGSKIIKALPLEVYLTNEEYLSELFIKRSERTYSTLQPVPLCEYTSLGLQERLVVPVHYH